MRRPPYISKYKYAPENIPQPLNSHNDRSDFSFSAKWPLRLDHFKEYFAKVFSFVVNFYANKAASGALKTRMGYASKLYM